MRRALIFSLAGAVLLATGAGAQDRARTLADIRQEMSVLYVEIQKLRRELSTTGGPQVDTGAGSLLDRVGTIESELQRLTAKTEELEFRIDRIVQDGTNRIGDLEFRLVELEGGDVSRLGTTTTLGGDTGAGENTTEAAPSAAADRPQLASQEAADFARAQAALDEGNYETAAADFATFNQNYPGGPLAVEADLRRGDALAGLSDTREAARAYLQAFTMDETGPLAPEALTKLGVALADLGQLTEACVTLDEVAKRFPNASAVETARAERAGLDCG